MTDRILGTEGCRFDTMYDRRTDHYDEVTSDSRSFLVIAVSVSKMHSVYVEGAELLT